MRLNVGKMLTCLAKISLPACGRHMFLSSKCRALATVSVVTLRAILTFEGLCDDFQAIFGNFRVGFSGFRLNACSLVGLLVRGVPRAAPRRLNVGNMLDVDRYPKCCFNIDDDVQTF